MKRLVAERILASSKNCKGLLIELLNSIQSSCSEDEFRTLKKSVGLVLADLNDELDFPVYKSHPDLTPPELRDIRGL
jgi:hypothetical protein